ncbi:MAG: hypothetical protein COU10_01810 [Candidatus Harrisonbacteria bacterium CG10_big_fil_rev_8_21_14_0_10_45_28]|uniref:Uncharacterized protein n=1 Tax=Candidatus Harrisonbacteria bacterium CG10_big_fil_rev_8_21_14_0_10_45_28 TaxID=1974586 RepID=A0A2H0UNI2_9BACT|nr:MAG: hypothetical protein COU10_01810 [Candidatus Harrisonbacteria bacterium CG10_big_fil_rev_8_21_14_0_10_45_28]
MKTLFVILVGTMLLPACQSLRKIGGTQSTTQSATLSASPAPAPAARPVDTSSRARSTRSATYPVPGSTADANSRMSAFSTRTTPSPPPVTSASSSPNSEEVEYWGQRTSCVKSQQLGQIIRLREGEWVHYEKTGPIPPVLDELVRDFQRRLDGDKLPPAEPPAAPVTAPAVTTTPAASTGASGAPAVEPEENLARPPPFGSGSEPPGFTPGVIRD